MVAIDHLTMVIAGAFLFHIATESNSPRFDKVVTGIELFCLIAGVFLFVLGAGAATISALGISW